MIETTNKPEINYPKPWYHDSILVKLCVIALIILALLIPSGWIQNLIDERQDSQVQNQKSISSQWSGSQLVQGPVLVIPYKTQSGSISNIYILPQDLHIKAGVKTEGYDKSIYKVTVYSSKIGLQGKFLQPDLVKLGIDPAQVLYDRTRLVFAISDLKGLKNTPQINIAGQIYSPEPVSGEVSPFVDALQVSFALPTAGTIPFDFNLELNGSNEINFLHTGKTTDVEVSSDWQSPQYNGRYLPDSRDSTKTGFKATWHMSYYNRPFPQQWINSDTLLKSGKAKNDAVFGVKLQVPIDQYHKVMRTTRYSTLIILLTFVSLFLTEVIRKQRIHLFNYTLIGAAMIIYYLLLLSFAEYIGYNSAYLLSATATVTLISLFTASLLNNWRAAGMFAFILSVFYGFIFIIIQMEEFSLMVGSIALFVVVAFLMYFSRKINWEEH